MGKTAWRDFPTYLPKVLQMADLPQECLRLLCPPFFSTGIDCLGLIWSRLAGGMRSARVSCLNVSQLLPSTSNFSTRWMWMLSCLPFIGLLKRPTKGDIVRLWQQILWGKAGTSRSLWGSGATFEITVVSQSNHRVLNHLQVQPIERPPFWRSMGKGGPLDKKHPSGGSWKPGSHQRCTVLVEAEGILNSKPLGYASTDILRKLGCIFHRHDSWFSVPQTTIAHQQGHQACDKPRQMCQSRISPCQG